MSQKCLSNSRRAIYHYPFMWPPLTSKNLRKFIRKYNTLFDLIQNFLRSNYMLPFIISFISLTTLNQLYFDDFQLLTKTFTFLFLIFSRVNRRWILPTFSILITINKLFMLSLINLFNPLDCLFRVQISY